MIVIWLQVTTRARTLVLFCRILVFPFIHRVTIGCYRRTSRLSRDYRGYRARMAYCARQIVDFEAAQGATQEVKFAFRVH